MYYLYEDLPFVYENASPENLATYNKHVEKSTKVACILMANMSPELQKICENYGTF